MIFGRSPSVLYQLLSTVTWAAETALGGPAGRAPGPNDRTPQINQAHPSAAPSPHGAVLLGVPLSRSRPPCLGRPCGPSHAIGFADPRRGVHSPEIGAYRVRTEKTRTTAGGYGAQIATAAGSAERWVSDAWLLRRAAASRPPGPGRIDVGGEVRAAGPGSITGVPPICPEPPSTVNDRHQQQPLNLKLARALDPASKAGDMLVMRRSPECGSEWRWSYPPPARACRVRSKAGAGIAATQLVFRWATLACAMNAWVSSPSQGQLAG